MLSARALGGAKCLSSPLPHSPADAWALLQKRKRGGKEAKTDEYEMMRSPSPPSEAARADHRSAVAPDLSNHNMITLEQRSALERQKDELKLLKGLLKKDKKDKKNKKKKKEGKVGPSRSPWLLGICRAASKGRRQRC